ncbi:Cytochrome P450 [Rhypophila sp. PSN 637]
MGILNAVLWSAAAWTAGLTIFGLWSLVCLIQNYLVARKLGNDIPVFMIPIDQVNPLWVMTDRRILPVLKKLPLIGEFIKNSSFARFNYRGWELHLRYRIHREVGDVFAIATPGRVWLYIADPDALADVFRRKDDFPRCLEMTERLLNVFGPNISTVEGPEWKVQRKVIGACLNEQTNQVVWQESITLAEDMLQYWAKSPNGICSTADDVRTLSLHVLSKAGFGKSYKFEGQEDHHKSGTSASYKNALKVILENCVMIVGLGTKFFLAAADEHGPWYNRLYPSSFREIGQACTTFQSYITDTYEEAKQTMASDPSFSQEKLATKLGQRTFMTAMVQASQENSSSPGVFLTEQEIYGNIFVLNFAGHDTTAHTFTFAIYLLAAHPELQDWISEEINIVFGDQPLTSWNYTDYPKLKRIMAVLLETVRIYTPVPVSKWTGRAAGYRHLQVGDKQLMVPSEVMISPAYATVQTEPRYWGEDSLEWRPERWITKSESDSNTQEEQEIIQPRKGTYIPWSAGVRDCPGEKFSKVEFVATLAALFRGDWRVEPAKLDKTETDEQARKRVLDLVKYDSEPVLLLQMLHPERAGLVWKRRAGVKRTRLGSD